jgi:SAM-dependent methyltransferase
MVHLVVPMTPRWHEIWNRRTIREDFPIDLQTLLALDGFDTPASKIETADWRKYVDAIAQEFNLSNRNSVYEVGCGAGAVLYGLRERLGLQVGGCDYSVPLVSIARRAVPSGDFTFSDAAEFPVSPAYDVVIANGVFHYFPDLAYSRRVLERMVDKARCAVGILDVPDEATREVSEQMRRELFSPHEYAQQYAGLDHQYFPRSWFCEVAKALSMECNFLNAKIAGYAQSEYRFGVLLRFAAPKHREKRNKLSHLPARVTGGIGLDSIMGGDFAFDLRHAGECFVPARFQFAATSRLAGSAASYCRKARSAA